MQPLEPLLTCEQVCKLLALDLHSLYRLIKKKQIGAVRVGRSWRFFPADIQVYISHPENQKRMLFETSE
jgi:excisionase family DNA binding protein